MENQENKISTEENLKNNPTSQPTSPQVQESIIAQVPEESQPIPQKSIIIFPTAILLVIVSVFSGYLIYQNRELKKALKINSFNDCIKENGIIQDSYPRVCVTKDRRRFTEEIKETPVTLPLIEEPEPTIIPQEKENEATSSPNPEL